jgi:hypothetical protein
MNLLKNPILGLPQKANCFRKVPTIFQNQEFRVMTYNYFAFYAQTFAILVLTHHGNRTFNLAHC